MGFIKLSIRQKLLIFSIVILAGIALIGYSFYRSNLKLDNSRYWVRHTEQVIYHAGNILALIKDVESASRGFVITNDSSFLEPLVTAKKTSLAYIKQLLSLVADNPIQQKRAELLNFYMIKRLDYSFEMVNIRGRKGLMPAIAYTSTMQGKHYADQIQKLTTLIKNTEIELLRHRKQESENSMKAFRNSSMVMVGIMAVFTILFLLVTVNYFLQNRDKAKKAAALIVANQELAYQSKEKERKAAELIIANKELAYQNNEKEKRAAELIVANKELAFQNKEKEKRAAELIVANKELVFQNDEKEMRAAELIIANK